MVFANRSMATDSMSQYTLTSGTYSYTADWDAAVQAEFGADAQVADFAAIEANFTGRAAEFCDAIGLTSYRSAALCVYNGTKYDGTYDGNQRYYYMERHDGNKPSNFLAHSNIDNYTLSLGSWFGTEARMHIAVKLSQAILTLSQGSANPQNLAVHPEGEPFTVNHIKLSLDESASEDAVISNMSFAFSGNGNTDYIHHVELHKDEDCDGISDAAIQSSFLADGNVSFEGLGETISPATEVCYLLQYVFDYEHGSQDTAILAAGEDCEDIKYGASINPNDITAFIGENQVEVEGASVEGQVIPQIMYIVTHNASQSIEGGRFVEAANYEVLGAWVGLEVCNGESAFKTTVGTDNKFDIYIENGTSLNIFSQYSNQLGFTLSYCNNTKDTHKIQQVNQLIDFYSDDEYIKFAIGDQIDSPYENCCLKFAGNIRLVIVGKNRGWSNFKEDVLYPLRQSMYWSEEDVTIESFRKYPAYNHYFAKVKVRTTFCNAKASELLLKNPVITFDGRKIEVIYE